MHRERVGAFDHHRRLHAVGLSGRARTVVWARVPSVRGTRPRGLPSRSVGERPGGSHAGGRGDDTTYQALSLDVLRIEDGIVAEITGFVVPDLFPAFGLAPIL